jgi:DNA-binding response OmpR family regulator
MHTALVVIDDHVVGDVLMANFRAAGFHPVCASDLDEARRLVLQFRPDIVVVDIDRYPPESVLTQLEWAGPDCRRPTPLPTIMLTASPLELCGPRGERCGTAYCSPKPFRPKELVMTAVRLVRRANARLADARWSGVIRRGPVELDLDRFTMTVHLPDRRVPFGLGPTVTRLMAQLMRRPGTVCAREELLAQVWPNDTSVTARTIDQNIRRLRATLRQVDLADSILTVEGQGYSFVLPPAPPGPAERDLAGIVTLKD